MPATHASKALRHNFGLDFASALKQTPNLSQLLWKGKFGLESERPRVTTSGHLANTPHPPGLGNKSEHPYITTDFSESQLEFITPPMDTLLEARGFLQTLLNIARENLPADELLWPQSMPPILPDRDEDIPLARFDGDPRGRSEYRAYLATIYGRARQIISGNHFSFSFSAEFFQGLSETLELPIETVREQTYLKVVRNLMRERWFLVGLLGRSPLAHESLRLKDLDSEQMVPICCDCGTSIRGSQIGYRNRDPLVTDYCCFEGYQRDLEKHIRDGKLLNANELYHPVRIKTTPEGKAISHLEIRVMDLDPFDPVGARLESLYLMHQFVVYSLFKDESGRFDPKQQKHADTLQNEVACWGLSGRMRCCNRMRPSFDFAGRAREILRTMETQLEHDAPPFASEYERALQLFRGYVEREDTHPANRLRAAARQDGFIPLHLQLAREQNAALDRDRFRFHAYADLELSTQLLLKAAIRRGIHFDVLDRQSNFIRLVKGPKSELVVQATKTSLDRYSQVLAMENKKVTKQILAESGIATPEGSDYSDPASAKLAWTRLRNTPVVIKPTNTNFGLGIAILPQNSERERFEQGIDDAFQEDRQILIERFVTGKEYRFFVIEDQVVAILHRVAANVVGDGRHTIEELVAAKNQDPLRGKGYVTPLEKLQLGPAEQRFLAAQAREATSVPAAGETVFLRENSNISTGGDSIDYTDRAHPSYCAIAAAAAHALGVKITGLDLIAQDIESPATPDNHAIIEMNFNPAIHIHCHPYHGENRKLDERILSDLGFF